MDQVATTQNNAIIETTRVPLHSTVNHSYGTRIRQNSTIKPSARLRQSPDPPTAPRRIKPVPSSKLDIMPSDNHPLQVHNMPMFPPSNIMLHPDDANNKVFLAIGRAFLSVDNRAMTIKDLAEMTMNFGLVCQNVSAAGQAITTYIRNHMQRCEKQGDHPLLLRHILSGTSSDDDLLPALHSRTGGAHCTINSQNRSTNFRRGTMVWYLSRATGASCPFTRAGIRVCEYGENGKVPLLSGSREKKKKERDRLRRSEQCGQKRKRQLRGYKGSGHESSEESKKPPKVKLTLRLRPCGLSQSPESGSPSPSSSSANVIDLSKESDSEDSRAGMMSVDSSSDEEELEEADVPWSLPPYPKRSISIPCYTPCVESFPTFLAESPSYSSASPTQGFVRSSSVPFSIASPPPDSEDEDDYHISMTGSRPFSNDIRPTPEMDPEWDVDFDSDGEHETQWESPGPRSPSAPLVQFDHEILVKQEPKDVEGLQGMLDHWEPLDSNIDGNKVVEVVAKAAAGLIEEESSMSKVKVEELEFWGWPDNYGSANAEWYRQSEEEQEAIHIKQEDIEPDYPFMLGVEPPMLPDEEMPYSPLSPLPGSPTQSQNSAILNVSVSAPSTSGLRRHSELTWKDVELLGPDSVHPHEFEDGEWQEGNGGRTVRMRAKTQPSLPTFELGRDFSSISATRPPEASTASVVPPPDDSSQPNPYVDGPPPSPSDQLQGSSEPQAPVSLPTQSGRPEACEIVVVYTCQPCTPAISATQVEGISVYQMTLGSLALFRRIDTDFVNLSPIAAYLGIAPTSSSGAVVVNQGSAIICGTWVPLTSAQSFVQQHSLPNNPLETFLSDLLFERFPSALQDFHRSNAPGRLLNHFGPHFRSTVEAKRRSQSMPRSEVEVKEAVEPWWDRGLTPDWDVADDILSGHPPFSLALAALRRPSEDEIVPETPLSPTEQEMFQTLCAMPDWEKENVVPPPTVCKEVTSKDIGERTEEDSSPAPPRDQPRRRSKRVANATANAIAARTRTRTQKRNSHNSLS